MPWQRASRFKLVPEEDADERTREIYDEIKQALGVPQVNAFFQAFAAYPKFLELFWQAMRPAVETQQFFHLGNCLRAETYTRVYNYFPVPDLGGTVCAQSPADGRAVVDTVDLFHYVDPLLLLLAAVLMQAFEEPVGQPSSDGRPAAHPVFFRHLQLVAEEIAPPQIRTIYEDMKHTLGVPALSPAYQAFARFPLFLESYWKALKPATQSPLYILSRTGVCDTAWSLLPEFPARAELTPDRLAEAGILDDDITAVMRVASLSVEALSRLVLNVALAKIGLEGGNLQVGTAQVRGEPQQAA